MCVSIYVFNYCSNIYNSCGNYFATSGVPAQHQCSVEKLHTRVCVTTLALYFKVNELDDTGMNSSRFQQAAMVYYIRSSITNVDLIITLIKQKS